MFEFKRNRHGDSSATSYVKNNNIMLNNLKKNKRIDGEIRFLACDSTLLNKGIGSKLLREFESRSKNKNVIYLLMINVIINFMNTKIIIKLMKGILFLKSIIRIYY